MKPSEFAKKRIIELFEFWKAHGGTQVSLAEKCGITQGQINSWLRGGFTPGIDNLHVLAKGFSVSILEFFPEDALCPSIEGKNPSQKKLAFVRDIVVKLSSLEEDELDGIRTLVMGYANRRIGETAASPDRLRNQKHRSK